MAHTISVEGVSKRYTLHHLLQPRYGSMREMLAERTRSFAQRLWSPGKRCLRESDEEFWALKDINFSVDAGDRLGIVGRNGAGKSTLLKILSRITDPSEGRISIRGRLSSLLEVGTGFHPELTGRENIFLNGTILGMKSRDIRRKFDEIVAFAEIEQFLDTPVKRYSSGMYVRLAFAVAAHLEPDILVIDEVLAVGDVQFQKKCLGKMQEVTGEGRTVLFVSHSMTTVNSLCNKCLLLEKGALKAYGSSPDITKLYFAGDSERQGTTISYPTAEQRPGDDVARLHSARIIDEKGELLEHVRIDQSFGVEMVFDVLREGHRPVPNFHVFTQGQYAFISGPVLQSKTLGPGRYRTVMWIPGRLLNEGLYTIGLALSNLDPVFAHFYEQEALYITVIDDLHDENRNGYMQSVPGIIRPRLNWDLNAMNEGQS